MRTILASFIVLISVLLVGCSHSKTSHDKDYRGKWLLVNYWATWCKPCLTEMPVLDQLAKSHAKKLVVLGVSFDKLGPQELKAARKQYGVTYPLMQTFPIEKYGINKLAVLPITFVINPQGKLVATLKGPQTAEQFLSALHMK